MSESLFDVALGIHGVRAYEGQLSDLAFGRTMCTILVGILTYIFPCILDLP